MVSKLTICVLFLAFFAGIAFGGYGRHYPEQKRNTPRHWTKGDRADPDHVLQIMVGLEQHNLDILEKTFWQVSDPSDPLYGKHLSIDQITELIAPAEAKIKEVKSWLSSFDVRHQVVKNKDYIVAEVPVKIAEDMLQVKFHEFTHISGKKVVRSDEAYSVPADLANHIRIISGVTHFPAVRKDFSYTLASKTGSVSDGEPIIVGRRSGGGEIFVDVQVTCTTSNGTMTPSNPCSDHPPAVTGFTTMLQWDAEGFTFSVETPIENCNCYLQGGATICMIPVQSPNVRDYDDYQFTVSTNFGSTQSPAATYPYPIVPGAWLTPSNINNLYGVPKGTRATNPNNRQGVAEFIGQYYDQSDLTTFFEMMGQTPRDISTIIGGNNASSPGIEAILDVEYIMGMAPGVDTWFWYLPGDAFVLEWAVQVSNTDNAPWVHSISYGGLESEFGYKYVEASNVELMKLGLRGITVVVSSGDTGVYDEDTSQCGPFNPDFPGGSPYILSLSATRTAKRESPLCFQNLYGNAHAPVRCNEWSIVELPCQLDYGTGFTTGGGFSNFNSIPEYQYAAVQGYLNQTKLLPPSSLFNATGRGYPDVSAIGHNVIIVANGIIRPVDGTSASAPIFAALISLLNDIRLNAGGPTFGFINPWIYQVAATNPGAFNDIVVGNNRCAEQGCCEYGFNAAIGWDPITGLGTPNFAILQSIVNAEVGKF